AVHAGPVKAAAGSIDPAVLDQRRYTDGAEASPQDSAAAEPDSATREPGADPGCDRGTAIWNYRRRGRGSRGDPGHLGVDGIDAAGAAGHINGCREGCRARLCAVAAGAGPRDGGTGGRFSYSRDGF